jgi:hypothetical protein
LGCLSSYTTALAKAFHDVGDGKRLFTRNAIESGDPPPYTPIIDVITILRMIDGLLEGVSTLTILSASPAVFATFHLFLGIGKSV